MKKQLKTIDSAEPFKRCYDLLKCSSCLCTAAIKELGKEGKVAIKISEIEQFKISVNL